MRVMRKMSAEDRALLEELLGDNGSEDLEAAIEKAREILSRYLGSKSTGQFEKPALALTPVQTLEDSPNSIDWLTASLLWVARGPKVVEPGKPITFLELLGIK